MRKIEWKESFSVGVKSLDSQHQEVVSHLNTIFTFFEDPTKRSKMPELLTNLENYAVNHFSTEEKLFEKYKYHATEDHKKEHQLYVEKMRQFRQRLDNLDESVFVGILEFLSDWWMGHIQGCDQDYKRFLNNCGVF
jgi:hemerythrin